MAVSNYDVVIVGGGMVGLSLAAKLSETALKIAVVDPKPVEMDWPKQGYDCRVSAITRASENLFKQVGAWKNIAATEKSAYQRMLVWDGESSQGKIEFDASAIDQANIGHIIENRVLRRSLFQVIVQQSNIDWLAPETCQQVNYQQDSAELFLKSGAKIRAKLLVAADGAFSWLRQASGIELKSKSYEHKAIVCTVETTLPHNKTAYQRFDQHGPLAFLPLAEQYHCSIVWSQDGDKSEFLLGLDDADFMRQLEQSFEQKLGAVISVSPRMSFPLFERTAQSMIAPRLALIGDAAHTIHPLAGQGVNLGFSDTKQLVETITICHNKGKDFGLQENLRPFERARKGEIWLMQQSMMGLKKLFEQSNPAVQLIRGLGLESFNRHSIIKRKLIQKAMGL